MPAASKSIDAFVEAAKVVVQMTLNRHLLVGSVEPQNRLQLYDYTTSIPLSGQVGGLFLMSVGKQTAHAMALAMMGEDPADGSDELIDTVAELGNMVAGNAKSLLVATKSAFDITLPVTYTGTGNAVFVRTGMPGSLARCSLDDVPILFAVWRAKAD